MATVHPIQPVYDAVVVGGGPAGLSAALVLGRARRRVLVVDAGRPANAASSAVGGLLAQNGVAPTELRAAGRDQLAEHPTVEVRDDTVLHAARGGRGDFLVALGTGRTVHTRTLLLAHGLSYDPPSLPGISEHWGRSAFHCPFCDGWEVRDRALAIHGNGPDVATSALVLSGWSRDVVLCTDGPAQLGAGRDALERAGIRVREERVRRLTGRDGQLQLIEFDDGPAEERDALFVRTRRTLPSGLAVKLGCRLDDGGTIAADIDGRTSVAGVFAAGDAATPHGRSVANAIGTGSRVGQAVATDLLATATFDEPGAIAA